MPSTEQENRYRVLRPLASGGMADVALAEDTTLGRWVALKRLRTGRDRAAAKRLRREALVGASLSHQNLVSIYDVWESDGDLVIVMEYVAGDTLRDLIRERGAVPAQSALRILSAVAAALDAVHARGIVHRDVKPANVLLGLDGQVKLADLGIAAVDDHTRITTSGEVLGTFRYMAPEQLEGAPSKPAMDIYALAAVAFETLCGRKARPEANPLALAHAIATRPPPDLRDHWARAPRDAAAVLKRAMAADPAMRPRSASELVARLRAAFDPETTQSEVPFGLPLPVPVGPEPSRDVAAGRSTAAAGRSTAAAGRSTAAAGRRSDAKPGASPAAALPSKPAAAQPTKPAAAQPTKPAAAQPLAAAPKPSPPAADPPDERRRGLIALGLLVALIAVVAAVAALSSGGGTPGASRPAKQAQTAPARRHAAQQGRAHTTSSAPTSPAASAATDQAAPAGSTGSSGSSASAGASGASGTSRLSGPTVSSGVSSASSTTPAGAVQTFYQRAARHEYAAAWQLADENLRNQLAGYGSFQGQMSQVRAITFHEAQVLSGGAGSSSATVAVRTTSALASRTQNCAGTVRTVRGSSGSWLLDHISIGCSPA